MPQRLSAITDPAAIGALISEMRSAEHRLDSYYADNRWEQVVELVRDDGLVTSLLFDPHANVLDDRVVGQTWADVPNR